MRQTMLKSGKVLLTDESTVGVIFRNVLLCRKDKRKHRERLTLQKILISIEVVSLLYNIPNPCYQRPRLLGQAQGVS